MASHTSLMATAFKAFLGKESYSCAEKAFMTYCLKSVCSLSISFGLSHFKFTTWFSFLQFYSPFLTGCYYTSGWHTFFLLLVPTGAQMITSITSFCKSEGANVVCTLCRRVRFHVTSTKMGFKLFLSSEVIKCIQFRQLLRSSPEKHCIVKILMSGVSSAGAMRLIKVSQSRCQALHVLSFSALWLAPSEDQHFFMYAHRRTSWLEFTS